VHWAYEAVSVPRQSLYIARLISRIAKCLAKLIDGRVETVLEVTSSRPGPKTVAKIFTGNQVAGPIDERTQNLARLRREFDSVTVLS